MYTESEIKELEEYYKGLPGGMTRKQAIQLDYIKSQSNLRSTKSKSKKDKKKKR